MATWLFEKRSAVVAVMMALAVAVAEEWKSDLGCRPSKLDRQQQQKWMTKQVDPQNSQAAVRLLPLCFPESTTT